MDKKRIEILKTMYQADLKRKEDALEALFYIITEEHRLNGAEASYQLQCHFQESIDRLIDRKDRIKKILETLDEMLKD